VAEKPILVLVTGLFAMVKKVAGIAPCEFQILPSL
jgi:hypothetical protein